MHAALSGRKTRLQGGTRIEFFEDLWNAGNSLITEYFTNSKKGRLMMELRLRDGARDEYKCTGDYTEFIDPYAEEVVYVNLQLNRAVIFYGRQFQIISLDYYGDYMCLCKLIGDGLYLE